jgi:hypothetical protein
MLATRLPTVAIAVRAPVLEKPDILIAITLVKRKSYSKAICFSENDELHFDGRE